MTRSRWNWRWPLSEPSLVLSGTTHQSRIAVKQDGSKRRALKNRWPSARSATAARDHPPYRRLGAAAAHAPTLDPIASKLERMVIHRVRCLWLLLRSSGWEGELQQEFWVAKGAARMTMSDWRVRCRPKHLDGWKSGSTCRSSSSAMILSVTRPAGEMSGSQGSPQGSLPGNHQRKREYTHPVRSAGGLAPLIPNADLTSSRAVCKEGEAATSC